MKKIFNIKTDHWQRNIHKDQSAQNNEHKTNRNYTIYSRSGFAPCPLPFAFYPLPFAIYLLPFAICLFLLPSKSIAQTAQPLDLKQAIELGSKNNLNIQASELESKMHAQLKGSAFEIPKTEVSGTFGQINSNAKDKSFSISQSFNPFQYGSKKSLLNENNAAGQLKVKVTKQETTFNIRQSWNAMLYYTKQNQLLENQNKLMEKFVKAASLKFQTGETNSLEKTIAIAKQQELQQLIKQNDAKIWVEKSKIKALINRDTDFTPADTTFVALSALSVADSSMIKQNSAIQLAAKQVHIAEAFKKVEKATLFPDITAGYAIQSITGNQEVNGQAVYYDASPRFQTFSVGLALPIFAGSSIAKTKAAQTNIDVQKKNAAYLENQLKSQFQQQIQELHTYQSLVDYYKNTALPNAKKISNNATKAYQNGDISYVEYVQSIETALNIQLNNSNAIHNFNQTAINIQYLINN